LAKFFDFTKSQIVLVAVLASLVLIQSGWLLIRAYAYPRQDTSLPALAISTPEPFYEGVFRLDPNTAPADSLELLEGIGPVLANRIVAFRRTQRIEEIDDLLRVDGIGSDKLERIRPFLTIGQP